MLKRLWTGRPHCQVCLFLLSMSLWIRPSPERIRASANTFLLPAQIRPSPERIRAFVWDVLKKINMFIVDVLLWIRTSPERIRAFTTVHDIEWTILLVFMMSQQVCPSLERIRGSTCWIINIGKIVCLLSCKFCFLKILSVC